MLASGGMLPRGGGYASEEVTYLVKDDPPIALNLSEPSAVPAPRICMEYLGSGMIFYCFRFNRINQYTWFLDLKALLNIVGVGMVAVQQ